MEEREEVDHTFIITFNKPLSRLVSRLIPTLKGRRTPRKVHPLRGVGEVYVHSPLSLEAINIMEAMDNLLGPHDEYLAYQVNNNRKPNVPIPPVLARLRIDGHARLVRGNDIPEIYRA